MSFPPHRRFVNHLCGGFLFKSLWSFFICACLCASRPLLFHSAIPSKPYKPSRFLIFLLFFRIEENGLGGLGNGILVRVTEAKKEAGPDEFLWNSSDSASCFLCSFMLGHLDGSWWAENKESYLLWVIRGFAITIYKPLWTYKGTGNLYCSLVPGA